MPHSCDECLISCDECLIRVMCRGVPCTIPAELQDRNIIKSAPDGPSGRIAAAAERLQKSQALDTLCVHTSCDQRSQKSQALTIHHVTILHVAIPHVTIHQLQRDCKSRRR